MQPPASITASANSIGTSTPAVVSSIPVIVNDSRARGSYKGAIVANQFLRQGLYEPTLSFLLRLVVIAYCWPAALGNFYASHASLCSVLFASQGMGNAATESMTPRHTRGITLDEKISSGRAMPPLSRHTDSKVRALVDKLGMMPLLTAADEFASQWWARRIGPEALASASDDARGQALALNRQMVASHLSFKDPASGMFMTYVHGVSSGNACMMGVRLAHLPASDTAYSIEHGCFSHFDRAWRSVCNSILNSAEPGGIAVSLEPIVHIVSAVRELFACHARSAHEGKAQPSLKEQSGKYYFGLNPTAVMNPPICEAGYATLRAMTMVTCDTYTGQYTSPAGDRFAAAVAKMFAKAVNPVGEQIAAKRDLTRMMAGRQPNEIPTMSERHIVEWLGALRAGQLIPTLSTGNPSFKQPLEYGPIYKAAQWVVVQPQPSFYSLRVDNGDLAGIRDNITPAQRVLFGFYHEDNASVTAEEIEAARLQLVPKNPGSLASGRPVARHRKPAATASVSSPTDAFSEPLPTAASSPIAAAVVKPRPRAPRKPRAPKEFNEDGTPVVRKRGRAKAAPPQNKLQCVEESAEGSALGDSVDYSSTATTPMSADVYQHYHHGNSSSSAAAAPATAEMLWSPISEGHQQMTPQFSAVYGNIYADPTDDDPVVTSSDKVTRRRLKNEQWLRLQAAINTNVIFRTARGLTVFRQFALTGCPFAAFANNQPMMQHLARVIDWIDPSPEHSAMRKTIERAVTTVECFQLQFTTMKRVDSTPLAEVAHAIGTGDFRFPANLLEPGPDMVEKLFMLIDKHLEYFGLPESEKQSLERALLTFNKKYTDSVILMQVFASLNPCGPANDPDRQILVDIWPALAYAWMRVGFAWLEKWPLMAIGISSDQVSLHAVTEISLFWMQLQSMEAQRAFMSASMPTRTFFPDTVETAAPITYTAPVPSPATALSSYSSTTESPMPRLTLPNIIAVNPSSLYPAAGATSSLSASSSSSSPFSTGGSPAVSQTMPSGSSLSLLLQASSSTRRKEPKTAELELDTRALSYIPRSAVLGYMRPENHNPFDNPTKGPEFSANATDRELIEQFAAHCARIQTK